MTFIYIKVSQLTHGSCCQEWSNTDTTSYWYVSPQEKTIFGFGCPPTTEKDCWAPQQKPSWGHNYSAGRLNNYNTKSKVNSPLKCWQTQTFNAKPNMYKRDNQEPLKSFWFKKSMLDSLLWFVLIAIAEDASTDSRGEKDSDLCATAHFSSGPTHINFAWNQTCAAWNQVAANSGLWDVSSLCQLGANIARGWGDWPIIALSTAQLLKNMCLRCQVDGQRKNAFVC